MGISASTAKILCGMFKKHEIGGSCLTMGRQDIIFSQEEFDIVKQQVLADLDSSFDRSSGSYNRQQKFIDRQNFFLSDEDFFLQLV